VHHTRALATVIDKRTFAEFDFTPVANADLQPTVKLSIDTKELVETFTWSWSELQAKAESLERQLERRQEAENRCWPALAPI
jgi:hypothetical protein